ncbi:MAG TPA: hypothetical protein VH253_06885, partial [Phycisphaerae bacterium]|nr:hypothetical protein [Phycisphaerae bacterium]
GPLVALPGDLNAPAAGTGMHNPEQSWDLPPLSAKGGKEGITVMLLGGTPLVATGAAGTLETDPPTGPGSESPPPAAATPEVRIRWQDKDAPTGTAWTAATLDLANNKLNLTWNAGFMLTHPDAIATVYWRLRAGTILRRGTDSNAARYEFRPWQSADIDFLQDAPAINAPIPFPEDATVSAINLPPGWQQESSGQSTGGTSTRPALAATQIIILRKPGEDATATPEFELLFRQGLTEVASTYAQKRQAADQSLADAQDELAAATQASTQPTSATANAGQTPQEAQSRIVPLTAQIARYKQAVAGYNELERFNAVVMLGGTRVGTIHFVRNPAATAPSSQPTTR